MSKYTALQALWRALKHVQQSHPEVDRVVIWKGGESVFMDRRLDIPEFGNEVDDTIIDEAVDGVSSYCELPFVFQPETFVIRNVETPQEFWSNNLGWVSLDNADRFADFDRDYLNLPLAGKWVEEYAALIIPPRFIVVDRENYDMVMYMTEWGWSDMRSDAKVLHALEAEGYKRGPGEVLEEV